MLLFVSQKKKKNFTFPINSSLVYALWVKNNMKVTNTQYINNNQNL